MQTAQPPKTFSKVAFDFKLIFSLSAFLLFLFNTNLVVPFNYSRSIKLLPDTQQPKVLSSQSSQVLQAQVAGGVNFLYDGGGQRIYKGVNGGEHTYYISPGVEVVFASDGTTSWRKNYYFSGKLVAVKDNSNGGMEQVNYIHQDHLGSTSLVTRNTGQVVSQQVYFPYGSTRTTNGTLPTEREYTSQISDQDLTGLYYYNARYYNPQIAKFTQADSQGDTLNKYAYVGNNPVTKIDPSGNQETEVDEMRLSNPDILRVLEENNAPFWLKKALVEGDFQYVPPLGFRSMEEISNFIIWDIIEGNGLDKLIQRTNAIGTEEGKFEYLQNFASEEFWQKEYEERMNEILSGDPSLLVWEFSGGDSFTIGYFNPVEMEIGIRSTLSPMEKLHTLEHEYIHYLDELGYRNKVSKGWNPTIEEYEEFAVNTEISAYFIEGNLILTPDYRRSFSLDSTGRFLELRKLGIPNNLITNYYNQGALFQCVECYPSPRRGR